MSQTTETSYSVLSGLVFNFRDQVNQNSSSRLIDFDRDAQEFVNQLTTAVKSGRVDLDTLYTAFAIEIVRHEETAARHPHEPLGF